MSLYSRLGKKVTIAMLVATAITAVISTAIQVGSELRTDIANVDSRLNRIDRPFIESVSDAVWQVDEPRLQFLLKMLKEQLKLTSVRLSSPDIEDVVLGVSPEVNDPVRSFELMIVDSNGAQIQLGKLTVATSLRPVYDQLVNRLILRLVVNGIKTVILVIILLFIANLFVTRRIKEFAQLINKGGSEPVVLTKTPVLSGRDEIDDLADTYSNLYRLLDRQRSKLDESNRNLALKVKELETAVIEKTERETELVAAKKDLESALMIKSAFVANTSHELRTPLTAIIGFLEILGQNLRDVDAARKYLQIIGRNSQHLLELVNDVLTFSGAEERALKLNQVPLDLKTLLEEIVENIRNLAEAKGLSVTVEFDSTDTVIINSDPHRIRLVLNNLIGNAIKFTDKGFVRIHCRSPVQIRPGCVSIEISVKDSGVGIHDPDKVRIFEPFTQADDSSTRHFGGSGLGLTISKKVAGLLKGDVTLAKSVPGQGAEFLFSFEAELTESPVRSAAESAFLSQDREVRKQGNILSQTDFRHMLDSKKIVAIDDNPDNLELIVAILDKSGATVYPAADGPSGVESAMQKQPDIVLMDIQMPGINGYMATKILRDSGFKKKIVALTAKADDAEESRCIQAGCDGLITKPIDIDSMVGFLVKVLGNKV